MQLVLTVEDMSSNIKDCHTESHTKTKSNVEQSCINLCLRLEADLL